MLCRLETTSKYENLCYIFYYIALSRKLELDMLNVCMFLHEDILAKTSVSEQTLQT